MEKTTKEMMEQFIAENINTVPARQMKKFEKLTTEKKYEKLQFFIEQQKMWEEAAEKNKLVHKVEELMRKKHATIQDAIDVMAMCSEYIESAKHNEIDRIDEEIARLTAMKESIENTDIIA